MSINDIQLCRKDLHQVTCVTGRSLGVLGTDKKKCQRVIVGADNGVITCFRMKKGAPEVEFETGNLDYPVSRLMIGGPVDKKDRIFFTSAQTIRGVTRKGKEFFRFTTDGAEPLRGLHVEDVKIWTSGEYMYNYYVDTKDAGYYMARDRINDLLIEPIINRVDGNAILGCQDRYVRVLDVNKLHYEAFVQGAVQSLSRFSDVKYSDVLKQVKEVPVIFGTDNGLLGELRMGTDSIRPGWLVQNVRGLGSITSVVPCDLTKNGLDDIIVGRDDGEIQVLGVSGHTPCERARAKTHTHTHTHTGVFARGRGGRWNATDADHREEHQRVRAGPAGRHRVHDGVRRSGSGVVFRAHLVLHHRAVDRCWHAGVCGGTDEDQGDDAPDGARANA